LRAFLAGIPFTKTIMLGVTLSELQAATKGMKVHQPPVGGFSTKKTSDGWMRQKMNLDAKQIRSTTPHN